MSGPPNRLGQQWATERLARAGGDRFAIYDLQNAAGTPIYVHAKVCIVDDEWMTCGSDNFNLRSWTHDTEIGCAVVDSDGILPKQLRIALWSEHLALAPDDARLADVGGAGALWRARSLEPGSRAKPHRAGPVSQKTQLWSAPLYRFIYDPDGRPDGYAEAASSD